MSRPRVRALLDLLFHVCIRIGSACAALARSVRFLPQEGTSPHLERTRSGITRRSPPREPARARRGDGWSWETWTHFGLHSTLRASRTQLFNDGVNRRVVLCVTWTYRPWEGREGGRRESPRLSGTMIWGTSVMLSSTCATNRRNQKPLLQNNQERTHRNTTKTTDDSQKRQQ